MKAKIGDQIVTASENVTTSFARRTLSTPPLRRVLGMSHSIAELACFSTCGSPRAQIVRWPYSSPRETETYQEAVLGLFDMAEAVVDSQGDATAAAATQGSADAKEVFIFREYVIGASEFSSSAAA